MAYGTTPNGGLITETNQQYYAGAQSIIAGADQLSFQYTFDTKMILGSPRPTDVDYQLNNFKLFTSIAGAPGNAYSEYIKGYTVVDNLITFIPGVGTSTTDSIVPTSGFSVEVSNTTEVPEVGDSFTIIPSDVTKQGLSGIISSVIILNPSPTDPNIGTYAIDWDEAEYGTYQQDIGDVITYIGGIQENSYVVVQLKSLDGGKYGDKDAYGNTVEENYQSYSYVKISDVIENFMMIYVGTGKLIPSVKRTDVIFHAKRALQEFSFDTLRCIKSQELTVPPNLSVVIPQDYVNYTAVSWIDGQGIKHPIYPNHLYSPPYTTPIQDDQGIPVQDNFGANAQGTSQITERWNTNDLKQRDELYQYYVGLGYAEGDWPWGLGFWGAQWGQQYGMQPEYANINGWFNIDDAKGTFSFSSDLVHKLILLEYISDGLGYEQDMKIPKMAEAAIYSYISHAVLASRVNVPEYLVNRYKKEKYAQLRNAKIRLSNIKPSEFVQVMRGKSKWIKH